MRKKYFVFSLLFGTVLNFTINVFAVPMIDNNIYENYDYRKNITVESIEDIQQKNYQELNEILEIMEIDIEKMDTQIEEIFRELDDVKEKIDNKTIQIRNSSRELEELEKELIEMQESFNISMRQMYINGSSEFVEILLSSNGMDEFISNYEYIKEILEYNKKISEELVNKLNEERNKKEILKCQKDNLIFLEKMKKDKLIEIETAQKDQKVLILEIKKQQQIYLNNMQFSEHIAKSEEIIGQTIKNIQQLIDESPIIGDSKPSQTISPEEIVVYATEFLGTPYVYGGNGPQYFDCSGFVKYVYAHFGIEISRTTFTQVKEGKYVSKEELRLGDLIFFGTKYNVHHVGIYVGNNCYIHAPHTGDKVKISLLSRKDYVCARRIIK